MLEVLGGNQLAIWGVDNLKCVGACCWIIRSAVIEFFLFGSNRSDCTGNEEVGTLGGHHLKTLKVASAHYIFTVAALFFQLKGFFGRCVNQFNARCGVNTLDYTATQIVCPCCLYARRAIEVIDKHVWLSSYLFFLCIYRNWTHCAYGKEKKFKNLFHTF